MASRWARMASLLGLNGRPEQLGLGPEPVGLGLELSPGLAVLGLLALDRRDPTLANAPPDPVVEAGDSPADRREQLLFEPLGSLRESQPVRPKLLLNPVALGARRPGELVAKRRARLFDAGLGVGELCRQACELGLRGRAQLLGARDGVRHELVRRRQVAVQRLDLRDQRLGVRDGFRRARVDVACDSQRDQACREQQRHERDRDPRPGRRSPSPPPSGRRLLGHRVLDGGGIRLSLHSGRRRRLRRRLALAYLGGRISRLLESRGAASSQTPRASRSRPLQRRRSTPLLRRTSAPSWALFVRR